MGCVICNIFAGIPLLVDDAYDERRVNELKEEMCNDIAVCHPEMVTRINEIREDHMMRVWTEYVEGDIVEEDCDMKIELTKQEIEEFAGKIFDLSFPDKEFGEFEDQDSFVRNHWAKAAYDAVDGYNCVVAKIDSSRLITFPSQK